MMKKHTRTLKKGALAFSLLDNHHIEEVHYHNIQINQFRGNEIFGSISDIFLRFRKENQAYSLFDYVKKYAVGDDYLHLIGRIRKIDFEIILTLASENLWFYQVSLSGKAENLDVVYVQDVGLGDKNGVQANELYLSQYLDHRILIKNGSNIICSRQNLGTPNPLLAQGALDIRITNYCTDQMQWLGQNYKISGEPVLLNQDLPNLNYQFELATIALQTERFSLNGKKTFAFYGYVIKHQDQPVTEAFFLQDIIRQYQVIKQTSSNLNFEQNTRALSKNIGKNPLVCRDFALKELDEIFGDRLFPEEKNNILLSFFTKDYAHVVLREKERELERPTGHIITSLNSLNELDKDLLTSTNYSYGLFNAQVAAGNTSMNKFLSANRGLLNNGRITGQRIYVKIDEYYQILGVPSAYEMGLNYAKWYYALASDLIEVCVFMSGQQNKINMTISSKCGLKYDYLLSHQIVMGEHEYINDYQLNFRESDFLFNCATDSFQFSTYPELSYKLHIINPDFTVHDDRFFYDDQRKRDSSLVIVKFTKETQIKLTIQGTIGTKAFDDGNLANFEHEKITYQKYYEQLLNGLHFEASKGDFADRLNITSLWFAHNAMVHYAVPHGLEQVGGAAWGTRDVAQGPMEFFLATSNYALARDILLKVFSYEHENSGEWPQWFFFDRYGFASDGCHGDIIFWPLKALADYLFVTSDYSLLAEKAPYFNQEKMVSIEEHVVNSFDAIEKRLIKPYDLISYAGGDWDDTLQPASKKMETRLVSSWTQALAYQTLNQLSRVLHTHSPLFAKVSDLVKRIQKGYQKHCFRDGVLAGFIEIQDNGSFRYLLHPFDDVTKIHYRLIPMTRSIIGELASPQEAETFDQIIDNHLTFMDGIRLMDRPAQYNGGISRHFLRAEQASNVGREISLLYMHAQIRYIEAMAKLGRADKVTHALLQVMPLDLVSMVPNAALRQANAYFSSSDGYYFDRYRYQEEFARLKDGSVPVRGGWRIYSSGPGIFIGTLIKKVLGIRLSKESIIIDPVVNQKFNGLKVSFSIKGQPITLIYHVEKIPYQKIEICQNGKLLPSGKMFNPYRAAGLKISYDDLDTKSTDIDVYLK
jgi:cellobiose phosphorylase